MVYIAWWHRLCIVRLHVWIVYIEVQRSVIYGQGVLINLSSDMDPRPYHFEYRRPRLANPTFESVNLYKSIYQPTLQHAPRTNPEAKALQTPTMKRASSTDINTKKQEPSFLGFRYNQNQSKMASYGSQLMRNSSMDQREVFEKQEKVFNIISHHPRQYRAHLKQFPKLTLQDKIFENQ